MQKLRVIKIQITGTLIDQNTYFDQYVRYLDTGTGTVTTWNK